MEFASSQEVMSESFKKFSVDLASRLSDHDMVWGEPYGPPASWKDGAPIGNGDFGALVYGYPDNLCFALGKTDIWDRSGPKRSAFKGKSLADVRKVYAENDQDGFFKLCDEPIPLPRQHATTAGMFRLHLHDADTTMKTTLRVSLWDGVSSLEFIPAGIDTNYTVFGITSADMLVSREHQVMAVRIRPSDTRTDLEDDPTMRKQQVAYKAPLDAVTWELSRAKQHDQPTAAPEVDGDMCWIHQKYSTGDNYVVAMCTVGGTSHMHTAGARLVGDIDVNDTDELTVYLTIVTNRDADDPVVEARHRLERARKAGFEEILNAHKDWWHNYWKRAYVAIGDQGVEKWWYTSLYLCGSIIQPGCQSPGLQGVWIKENIPGWLGDYHTNVNIQAVYWGLFGANRVDLMGPYVQLVKSLEPQAVSDTRNYFKMRGVRFPHAASIDGYELTFGDWGPSLGASVGGSSWFTQLIWQVYEYTGDKEYLKESAYPILKEVARFYEDYLIWEDNAGRWSLEPSLYFEALCPRFSCWGKNSLYELALVRSALERAITAAGALGVDDEDRSRWAGVVSKLAEFPTTPDGNSWIGFEGRDLREFGSHQFALPPVFPCELVSLWHGSEDLRKQAINTLNHPLTSKGLTGKPWCGGQGIRELIRMGVVDQAFEAARWHEPDGIFNKGWSVIPKNGLVQGWSTPYLQADHGPGMCSVLNDMLVLAPGGVLRLFPCFPEDVPGAFHSLRAPGAFLVSAEKRGKSVDYAVVKSLAGNELRLANSWQDEARVRDAKTGEVLIASDAGVLCVATQPGQVLTIDRTAYAYEEVPIIELS